MDQLSSTVTLSAVIVFVLQLAKNNKYIPLHTGTDRANRIIAIALSGIAALGIHHTYDATAGVLTISGLTLDSILHGGFEWLRSFAVQEWMYRSGVKS